MRSARCTLVLALVACLSLAAFAEPTTYFVGKFKLLFDQSQNSIQIFDIYKTLFFQSPPGQSVWIRATNFQIKGAPITKGEFNLKYTESLVSSGQTMKAEQYSLESIRFAGNLSTGTSQIHYTLTFTYTENNFNRLEFFLILDPSNLPGFTRKKRKNDRVPVNLRFRAHPDA